MRQLVHGALIVALAACGSRAPAPVQRAQPVLSAQPSAAASASAPPVGVAKPNYACPPAATSTFTVIPQGGIFGAAEIQVSKDGRIAAARPTPTEVQIWNLPSATKVAVVPSSTITRMSLRPDGRALALVSEGRVFLKDLEKGTFGPISIPGNDISNVEWTADSKLLFITRGAQVDIVDATGNPQSSLAVMAFPNGISPDGRFIVARDGSVWDVRANQVKWRIPTPSVVAFSEDAQTLAYGIADKVITVVDAATGARRWDASLTGSRGSDIAISADGQSVATYDHGFRKDPYDRHARVDARRGDPVDRGIALWHRGKRVRVSSARDARVVRAAFSPDGTKLAFVASHISESRLYDHEIKIAEVATGALVMAPYSKSNSLMLTGELRAEPPRWTSDSKSILQAGNGSLYVFDATKGGSKVIGKGASEASFNGTRDAVWSADDSALLLLAESSDRQSFRSSATILDLKSGTTRESLDARAGARADYAQRFRSAEWSSDGVIALMRADGIAVWDGRASVPLRMVDSEIGSSEDRIMALSPRGNVLATMTSSQREVRLWDAKTGAKKTSIVVDNASIEAIAFSVDGTRLALAGDVTSGSERSAQILIYDAQSAALVKTLKGPMRRSSLGRASTIHWAPQGRAIVAIDPSGKVELWNTTADDPPLTLIDRSPVGPSTLADGGNLLLMGRTSVDVWDLRTRTRARELPGDGTNVEHVRLNHAGTIAAVARGDHVDLFRVADGAHLTIRSTSAWQPNQSVLVYSDEGAFAGAANAFNQLRVRESSNQLEARPMRQDEATALYHPTLALDFVAGCPMTAK